MSVLKKMKKILITIVMASIVFSMGFISGCMTVQGAGADIGDFGRFVERSLEPAEQKREQIQVEEAAQLVLKNKRSVENSK